LLQKAVVELTTHGLCDTESNLFDDFVAQVSEDREDDEESFMPRLEPLAVLLESLTV
jgi:hypothetical protein